MATTTKDKDPNTDLGPGQHTHFLVDHEQNDTVEPGIKYTRITASSSENTNEEVTASNKLKNKFNGIEVSSSKQIKESKIKEARKKVSFRETRSEYTTDVFVDDEGQITITIRDPRTPDHIVTSKVLNAETGQRFEYDDYKGIKVAEYYGTNLATDETLTLERAAEYRDSKTRTISKAMAQLKKYKTANEGEYQFPNQPYYFIVYGKLIMVLLNTDVIDVSIDDFKVFRDLDEFCYEALWSLKTAFECTQCQIVFTTDMNSEIASLKATYEQDLNVQLTTLQALIKEDEYKQIQEVLKTYQLEDDFILHEKLIEARKKKWAEKERVQEVLNTIENLMLKYRMALNNEKYAGGYATTTFLSAISFNLTQPFYTSPKNQVVR